MARRVVTKEPAPLSVRAPARVRAPRHAEPDVSIQDMLIELAGNLVEAVPSGRGRLILFKDLVNEASHK